MKKEYLSQSCGSCCFVIAAINCLIHHKMPVPDLEKAYDIAKCKTGNSINCQSIIDYLGAPLLPTDDYWLVLYNGGILNIMHPIFNGHSIFVFPVNGGIRLINSWLGPNVVTVGVNEIRKFLPVHNNLGLYWRDNSGHLKGLET